MTVNIVNNKKVDIIFLVVAIALTTIIYWYDTAVPLGIAVGALYSLVILCTWLVQIPYTTLFSGLITITLVVIGYYKSPLENADETFVIANRIISIIIICICAILVLLVKKRQHQLKGINLTLEDKVNERTRKLKEREQLLTVAEKLTKTGSWEWYPKSDEVIWSDEMYNILGTNKEETSGKVQDIFDFVHPEDIEMVKTISAQAVEQKRAIPIEYRIITPEGVVKYIRGTGTQETDKNGKLIRLYGTIQDITEQVTTRNQFNNFWYHSLELMCIANMDGYFLQLNPRWREVLGFEEIELKEKPFIDFVHPEDKEKTIAEASKLAEGKHITVNFTNRYMTKKGDYKWLQWTSSADSDQKLLYAVARDVTKDKEQEEILRKNTIELAAKNKELEQFAYIASHDLQEPLRTVSSFVDLLKKDYENKLDENGIQYLQFISEGSERMRDLVKGLLDYSRIGKEKEKIVLDLNQLVDEIKADLRVTIEEKNAKINVNELPKIKCYATEVRQLFQNLISNGLKFQEKEKHPIVNIKAQKKNEKRIFSVQDNGIGIAKEHQEKIFKIFQRLHTRKQFKGTGIGLAHCQKIVELHHGKIWVESELGKGTTFHFTLNEV